MPREWKDIVRKSNIESPLKIFVIAYEGVIAEPKYFDALKNDIRFNDEIVHLEPLKRKKRDGRSDPKNVFNKLKLFYSQQKKDYNFKKDDEFWMIIDRDSWNCLPEIVLLCKAENNFFLALSNPCFELWLLLHINDVKKLTQNEKDLLFSNPKVSSSKNHIDIILGSFLPDGYNKLNPKPNRFIPQIQTAIERAKKMDNPNEDYPTYIGSHVYKLVEKLIK